ncbi:MAG: LLM class flavin-dependent oxidoreductase [Acidimicrobiales bacterium]|nr:LLM class flavin-dependent oxidoreductase [Acidimicrobiales bacterium]
MATTSSAKVGYLLPTREAVMAGEPGTARLLALSRQAEAAGYDSIWVGDSLLSRPRHEPLTLLAAVAAATERVELGTAVLLPALRNPVVLAQIVATLDQLAEGRLVLGVGVAADTPSIRAEFAAAGVPFEQRVGRFVHGLALCRALWTGEPVSWEGPYWQLDGWALHPTPYRPGGPPLWVGGSVEATLRRTGHRYDGWFPVGGEPDGFVQGWQTVRDAAAEVGRDPDALTGAAYVTLAVDEDAVTAEAALDRFLGAYYAPVPAPVMRRFQNCYAGPQAGAVEYLAAFVQAGASHLCLRFCGDHERNLDRFDGVAAQLG